MNPTINEQLLENYTHVDWLTIDQIYIYIKFS